MYFFCRKKIEYRIYSPELIPWILEFRYFESDVILGRHCQILYQEREWKVSHPTDNISPFFELIRLAPNCQLR